MTDWTDERIARLRDLWGAGRSASEIAEMLGMASRSAVMGKVFRLGLARDGEPPRRPRERAKPVGHAPRPPVVPVPPAGGVALADIREGMCRWPLGKAMERARMFCGCGVAPGEVYCRGHARKAYAARVKPIAA